MGKPYCKNCFRQAKKQSRYERMAQRDALGGGKPGKMW